MMTSFKADRVVDHTDAAQFVFDVVVPTLPSRQARRAVLEVRSTVAQIAELDLALGVQRTDVEILTQAIGRLEPLKMLGAKEAFARMYTAAQLELRCRHAALAAKEQG
jgi:hypothetical protein